MSDYQSGMPPEPTATTSGDSPGPGYWKASDGQWYPPQSSPPPPTATNGMATAALVLGILSICLFWFTGVGIILGILAIIFGALGLKRANEVPTKPLSGRAKAGLITGIVGTLAGILFVVIAIVAFEDVIDDLEIDSDPSDGVCDEDRFIQDPDCG